MNCLSIVSLVSLAASVILALSTGCLAITTACLCRSASRHTKAMNRMATATEAHMGVWDTDSIYPSKPPKDIVDPQQGGIKDEG